MCDQLAVALQNAQAYRTIDVLNADLAGKNVALEDANRELREAQDELAAKSHERAAAWQRGVQGVLVQRVDERVASGERVLKGRQRNVGSRRFH